MCVRVYEYELLTWFTYSRLSSRSPPTFLLPCVFDAGVTLCQTLYLFLASSGLNIDSRAISKVQPCADSRKLQLSPEVLCGTSLFRIQDDTRTSVSSVCLLTSAHTMCLDSNLKLLLGTFCLSWPDIFRTPGQLSFRKPAIWVSPHISAHIYIQFKCLARAFLKRSMLHVTSHQQSQGVRSARDICDSACFLFE